MTNSLTTTLSDNLSKYDKFTLGVVGSMEKVQRLKNSFMFAVNKNPKILECNMNSITKAFYTCCVANLEPEPTFGHIWLIPYGKELQVQVGYKGLIKLVSNSSDVLDIYANAIRENDEFDYMLGDTPYIKHKPAIKDRGGYVCFYCVAIRPNGVKHIHIMNTEEIDSIRDRYSAAVKGKRQSPWDDNYEEMAKKTILKQTIKQLPLSVTRELSTALDSDNAVYEGRVSYASTEGGMDSVDVSAEETEPPKTKEERKSRLDTLAQQQSLVNQEANG